MVLKNALDPRVSEVELGTEEEVKRIRRKVDWRLCTIAGVLCSLNLVDGGIISSASVAGLLADLQLEGNRYSVTIFIYTLASIAFSLPATLAIRLFGPRVCFALITFLFGVFTICTAFVHTWKELIGLRILAGIAVAGIFPGTALLISSWYTRKEQQVRFAFLEAIEFIILGTGNIVNYGLNHLDGHRSIRGWQWMYIVQGVITCFFGILTFWWMVDFPEKAQHSFHFLSIREAEIMAKRIEHDRGDVIPSPFSWTEVMGHFLDPKLYGFCALFFILNLVSTALAYFLPIILQGGLHHSADQSILLSSPPYYWSAFPLLVISYVGDKFSIRGPTISFNALCLIIGIAMLGFANQDVARYIGVYLATGAYASNWPALNAYFSNNITGQWKRTVTAAAVSACNGFGGIAGSYLFRQTEAPRYPTAIWVSIGSHILMIAIVLAFSVHFYSANRKQKAGMRLLERTEGFRYTY